MDYDRNVTPFDRTKCWDCKDWLGYMIRDRDTNGDGVPESGSFSAGDPEEDGDVGGHPGYWLVKNDKGTIVGLVGKKDCKDPNGVLQIQNWPRAETSEVVTCAPSVPCPDPTPTPGPSPGPTPTPGPGGVDNTKLLKFGSEYFACRVLKDGRTRIAINNTPRVAQFPSDTRGWEQPREVQDPRGPDCTQSRTGPGAWTNELMENTSTNPYLCHTALEDKDAGGRVYTFRATPRADLPLSPEPSPGFDRGGTVKVRYDSRGNVTCLDGCKANSPTKCTQ